jgi:hypothetical protein
MELGEGDFIAKKGSDQEGDGAETQAMIEMLV